MPSIKFNVLIIIHYYLLFIYCFKLLFYIRSWGNQIARGDQRPRQQQVKKSDNNLRTGGGVVRGRELVKKV